MNYKELDFKCGLEIHQQLETHKLFCNCPSIVRDESPDIKIVRKLRAVAGETGETDLAALHEKRKDKLFIYEACSTSSCLVELDEEPPHPINQDAVDIALEIALLLNAKIVDEIQIMRKTVVDGSNTSGFQRTALIATDGFIETSKGRVNIPTICLEEEAAKRIREDEKSVTFRLDRLGIPLIEVGTATDIKDPEHAKETASILGMILRSTKKVKRGLGTIRQDVNISIKGGARTEIKGFQDLRSIPKVIENEIQRQLNLIKENKKIEEQVRKAEPDFTTTYLRPMPGADRMYPETDIPPIIITEELLKKIKLPELITEKAIKLEKKYKISPVLARELIEDEIFDDYVKKFSSIEPSFIAQVLIEMPKEIKSRFKLDPDKIREKDIEEILSSLNKKEIPKSAVMELLVEVAEGKKMNFSKYKTISEQNLEKAIKEIVEKNKNAPFNALMGIVMGKFRGKVDGKKVAEIIKKLTK